MEDHSEDDPCKHRKPSFKESWNSPRQVMRLPVQLVKYSWQYTLDALESPSVAGPHRKNQLD